MIVDEGEARSNKCLVEIESDLIVVVESKIEHEIFNKKIDFLTIFRKKITSYKDDCFATRYLMMNS